MGGDGGSIAQRTELVRSRRKPEQLARDIKDAAKWKYCALTQEPLRLPIVTCPLGRLYNKEAVVRALIDKTIGQIENSKHITSLKDVKELSLTKNADFERIRADKGDVYMDPNVAQFICPVVGIPMNGKYRFCAVWTCGCVLSERALKEIKSDTCQKCGKIYSMDDVVMLYGTEKEVAQYSEKLEALHNAQKVERANKKATKDSSKRKAAENGAEVIPSTSKLKSAEKFAKKSVDSEEKSSVQHDSSKSQVFKSLFTTCEKAKSQPKAHWVTHNPLYY